MRAVVARRLRKETLLAGVAPGRSFRREYRRRKKAYKRRSRG